MPPKKQAQAGGSKKAEQKKKEKIIEVSSRGPETPLLRSLGIAFLAPRRLLLRRDVRRRSPL